MKQLLRHSSVKGSIPFRTVQQGTVSEVEGYEDEDGNQKHDQYR